jgi:hypothetical protein
MSKLNLSPADKQAIEAASTAAPSAPEVAQKKLDELKAVVEQNADRERRRFCIAETTKVCSAGGYEPKDIEAVLTTYYSFLKG